MHRTYNIYILLLKLLSNIFVKSYNKHYVRVHFFFTFVALFCTLMYICIVHVYNVHLYCTCYIMYSILYMFTTLIVNNLWKCICLSLWWTSQPFLCRFTFGHIKNKCWQSSWISLQTCSVKSTSVGDWSFSVACNYLHVLSN